MNINRTPRVDIGDLMHDVCELVCERTHELYIAVYKRLESQAFDEGIFPEQYTVFVEVDDNKNGEFAQLVKEVMKREGLTEMVICGNGSSDCD